MSDVGLDAELTLDIARALDSVTEIETALTSATTDVLVSFDLSALGDASSTITDSLTGALDAVSPEVDALGAQAAQALADVPVSADVSEAESALADLDAEASKPIDVPVAVDTSEAIDAIDGVQEQAAEPVDMPVRADTSEAESSVEGLKGGIEGLHATAEAATGSASGLAVAIGGIHPAAAAAAGAGVALAGATHEFYQAGVEAIGAAQRFETVVGDMGTRIKDIHVGDLNTDMEKLGIEFGSTGSAMENANSKLYAFAINAGASQEQAVQFTQQVEVLAARAISLNPNLGTLSDVMESMGPRLARGGRFAAEFGVALTPAEIAARALTDTGKTLTSELTVQEKAMAGAEIAAERYGAGLSDQVAKGSENAIVQQRSLAAIFQETIENIGKPIVAPMFDVIKAAEPDVALLGHDIGLLVVDALPLLESLLHAVAPPLQVIGIALEAVNPALEGLATVIDAIPTPVSAAVVGFFAFRAAITAAMAAMPGMILEASALQVAINPLAGALALGVAAFSLFSGGEHETVQASQELVDALKQTGDAAQQAVDAIELKAIADDEAARAAEAAGVSFSSMNEAVQAGPDQLHAYADALSNVSIVTGGQLVDALKGAGAESSEFGRQLIAGVESGQLNKDAVLQLLGSLGGLADQYVVSKDTADAETKAQQENSDAHSEGTVVFKDHAAAIQEVEDAMKAYNDQLHANIDPLFAMAKASKENADANREVAAAQDELNAAISTYGDTSTEANDAREKLNAAQDKALTSTMDLSSASEDLALKISNGSLSIQGAKDQLNAWVAQGLITQSTADALAAKFQLGAAQADNLTRSAQGTQAQLQGMNGLDVEMQMHLDDAQVQAALHQIGQLVIRLPNGQLSVEVDIAARGGGPRAAGGGVDPSSWYTVGELGPELFMPTVPGVIVPADITDQLRNAFAASTPTATATTAAAASGPRLNIETAYIGSNDVLPDLDWWATTRLGAIS